MAVATQTSGTYFLSLREPGQALPRTGLRMEIELQLCRGFAARGRIFPVLQRLLDRIHKQRVTANPVVLVRRYSSGIFPSVQPPITLPALRVLSQSLRFPPLRSCAKLYLICCPSPRSELRTSRPCRLPRLRLRRLFPLRARGETASELAKSFQPTAGSEPGGGFLLLSPLQRRSRGIRSAGHEP